MGKWVFEDGGRFVWILNDKFEIEISYDLFLFFCDDVGFWVV